MIVHMKKVSLLVLDKYKEESLFALRKLGVIHIKYMKQPSSSEIDSLESKTEDVDKALLILSRYPRRDREQKQLDKESILAYVGQIISWDIEKDKCFKRREDIKSSLFWYEEWEEFSLSGLKELAKEGVYIRFYKCGKGELENLKKKKVVKVIRKQANNYYIAVVSLTDREDINLQEIIPPDRDFRILQRELKAIEDRILSIDNLLMRASSYSKSISGYSDYLNKLLDFNKVKSSMQEAGDISYLQGFMPESEVPKLIELSNKKGWACLIQEPENPQEVPTLIKNPRWLRIIEPVFKFMGILPGYNEYDVSFSFLLFFSLFFALLIGDGGYGLVFLLATYLVRRKMSNLPPEPFTLMYVLGFATIIWGAISGTWFGFEKIAQLPFLKCIVVDKINSFIDSNQSFMMQICFLIGAVHLTIAHGIVALRIMNSLKVLSQIGWVLIIWSLFFVSGRLVLGNDLFGYVGVMFSLGIILVLLFSHPQRNMLKGIGITLIDLPLKVVSSFSDIISYLRLFAVGYATVAVAVSFNDAVLKIGFGNILTGLVSAIIIFLGHGLNIMLGLMAVIVHGIRLNMLEFSSHLGLQWSGIEYKPFKE